METILQTITHPKADHLFFHIVEVKNQDEIYYYFETDGDWYDQTWCKNPLKECISDAKQRLNRMYKGEINSQYTTLDY